MTMHRDDDEQQHQQLRDDLSAADEATLGTVTWETTTVQGHHYEESGQELLDYLA